MSTYLSLKAREKLDSESIDNMPKRPRPTILLYKSVTSYPLPRKTKGSLLIGTKESLITLFSRRTITLVIKGAYGVLSSQPTPHDGVGRVRRLQSDRRNSLEYIRDRDRSLAIIANRLGSLLTDDLLSLGMILRQGMNQEGKKGCLSL